MSEPADRRARGPARGPAPGPRNGADPPGSGPDRASPATKAARHAKIAAILAGQGSPVRSQDELADRLAVHGVRVTQTTLSRDLVELGAVRLRGRDGALVYALPPELPASQPSAAGVPGAARVAGPASAAGGGGVAGSAGGLGDALTADDGLGSPARPGIPASAPLSAATAALAKVATDLLLSAEASGNLAVIRTPPGAAQLLASMIDRAGSRAVLGTVAGDNTVIIVARDPAGGADLAGALLRLAEWPRRSRPNAAAPDSGAPDSGAPDGNVEENDR